MDEFKSRYYPIHEQMGVQRLTWVVERIGWLMLGAITLLALSGFFGTGLLSSRTISAGGLTVEYERFERKTKMTEFDFHFAAGRANASCISTSPSATPMKSPASSRSPCAPKPMPTA